MSPDSPVTPIRGVLNVNKPSGISSYDVIRHLKPLLPGVRLGHAGTLDPLADGVLLVLVGAATKVADYLQAQEKEYEAEILLGVQTDTDDITGKVLAERPVMGITEARIRDALGEFQGEIEQVPPQFSAVKVEGERAYRVARSSARVELKPRRVKVMELQLLAVRGHNPEPEIPNPNPKSPVRRWSGYAQLSRRARMSVRWPAISARSWDAAAR